jgi:tetratricopeptide (TPR) repeat protein
MLEAPDRAGALRPATAAVIIVTKMPALLLIACMLAAAAQAQTPTSAQSGRGRPEPGQGATAREPALTAGYYFLLGRHLETEDKIDEAIAAHKRAIALEPSTAELKAELAALYARQDRGLDAVQTAEAALRQDPANLEANRILGSVYAALAEQRTPLRPGEDVSQYPAKAIAALEKASRDGGDLGLNLLLGRMYVHTRAYDKAVPPLRRVIDEQPGYSEAAWLLATALENTDQAEGALAVLRVAVRYNPRFFRGQLRIAELNEKIGRWDEAAEGYARAQQLNARTEAELMPRRAAALINAGKAEEARDLLMGLAAAAQADVSVLYLYAVAQRQSDDLAGAEATAKRLREMAPADPRGMYVLAQVLEAKGDAAGAEASLRELLARDPKDATALNYLGYMFAERGARLDEAVDLVRRALEIEPDNPSFLDSLGWAYFRQGRLELADRPLTDAAAKLPTNSVVQDHLGDLRFKQGRYPEAAAAWERSLAGDGESIDRAAIEKKLKDAKARQ